MKRLPHVGKLTDQILARVTAETVKEAAVATPEFSVPIAQEVYKLAQQLRAVNENSVTRTDVHKFAQQLMGHMG